jgi:hypothetical protein
MAFRREEASTDLQQDGSLEDGSLAVRGERSAGARSPVDVAHPTNVARATIKPMSAMRLLEVDNERIGVLPGQAITADGNDQANRHFANPKRQAA